MRVVLNMLQHLFGLEKNRGLYTNLEDMIAEQSPDLIMVTTTDATQNPIV